MKNKISVLFFLFIVINTYGQLPSKGNKPKPVIIYDTISVYDTLVVYDTVKVYDKTVSENTNVVENALLTIDTASKKTSLSLFFENDTATIPINSIMLSENTKNVDTMKKEILTLVAAALLTQASVSQTITDSTTTVNTTENTTIAQNSQSAEKAVFKKKNSDKTYEVFLPSAHYINFKTTKMRKQYLPRRIYVFSHRPKDMIINVDSAFVTVLCSPKMKRVERKTYAKKMKALQKNDTLSLKEKQDKYSELNIKDSVYIPIEAIKNIRFLKRFDRSKKSTIIGYTSLGIGFLTINYFVLESILDGLIILPYPVTIAIVPAMYLLERQIFYCLSTKKIDLNKWEIVPQ